MHRHHSNTRLVHAAQPIDVIENVPVLMLFSVENHYKIYQSAEETLLFHNKVAPKFMGNGKRRHDIILFDGHLFIEHDGT